MPTASSSCRGGWERDAANANAFMQDVADRVVSKMQLTTDGNITYRRGERPLRPED
jgi:hypothetical protein